MWLFDGKHLTLQREGELWQPASYRNSFINPRHKELSQFVTLLMGKCYECAVQIRKKKQKKTAVNSLQSHQGHVWSELALNCKKKKILVKHEGLCSFTAVKEQVLLWG